MIKLDELMIGDWFQTTYPSGRVVYRKITGIFNNYVNTEDGTTNAIEPIPITPEILEKNGFESVKNIFGFKTYKLNDDFILEDRGKRKCLCRSCYKTQPSSTFWVCDIEYVNELQHALKLIGITKIIEL